MTDQETPETDARTPGWPHVPRQIWVGLAVLLAVNFFFRFFLEPTKHLNFLAEQVAPEERITLRDLLTPQWKYLLPFDTSQKLYHWFTTGLVPVTISNFILGTQTTFHLLNALVIVVSFGTALFVSSSPVLALAVACCMGLGTQFHYSYVLTSQYAMYLLVCYIQVNFACAWGLYASNGARKWKIAYVASLIVLALCHEMWLDYVAFTVLGCLFLFAYFSRWDPAHKHIPRFILVTVLVAAFIYIPVVKHFAVQVERQGAESEMILGYDSKVLAAEDFLSNCFTYTYIAFGTYLPPFLLSSTSDYLLGSEEITKRQHGYHPQMTHLVGFHHRYFWHFYAGIAGTLFLIGLCYSLHHALTTGCPQTAIVALACLVVLCGFSTHSLVKFRPYLSVPTLSYKCITSVVGVTYLIGLGVAHLSRDARTVGGIPAPVVALFGYLILLALTRPRFISHLHRCVGIGGYPDPMETIGRWLGR